MTDDRIVALETSHKSLATAVSNLAMQQSANEKLTTQLMAKIDAYFDSEQKYGDKQDHTLSNINEALNALRVDVAGIPNENNQQIRAWLDPIWKKIHTMDGDLSVKLHDLEVMSSENKHECLKELSILEDKVKRDILNEAKSRIIPLWIVLVFSISVVSSLFWYIEWDIRSDIKTLSNSVDRHISNKGEH